MTPRERARARLERHVSDFHHWNDREPQRSVSDREEHGPISVRERFVPGSTVRVRDGSGAVRNAATIDPSPNAPLLMRIVRDPYGLKTVDWVRVRWLEEDEAAAVEPVRVADVVREKRQALRSSPPMRIDHRPHRRPRPFEKVRGRGGDE